MTCHQKCSLKSCFKISSSQPRVCHTDWSKSEREKQILSIDAYMWNLAKQYWWTYFQGRNGDTDVENGLGNKSGEGKGGGNGESSTAIYMLYMAYTYTYMYIYVYMYVNQMPVRSCCTHRNLAWSLRGGMGVQVGGRLKKEGIHVHLGPIHLAVQSKPTQHRKAITLQGKVHEKKVHPITLGISDDWNVLYLDWNDDVTSVCVYIYVYIYTHIYL